MKVLVVEDDPAQRELLATVLERDGHDVAAIGSVEQAIGLLGRAHVDLIISDYDLGKVEGKQSYGTELRGLGPPLVIVSGYDAPNGYHDPWLLKPLRYDELLQQLDQYLRA